MESPRPRHQRTLGLLLLPPLLLLLLGGPGELVAATENSSQKHTAVSSHEQAAAELQRQDVASLAAHGGQIRNTVDNQKNSRDGRMIDFGSGLWNLLGQISMNDFEEENNGLSSGFYKYYRETRRRLNGKQQPYNELSREMAARIPQATFLIPEKIPLNEQIQPNVGLENTEINIMSPQTYNELKRLGYAVENLIKQDVSNDKIFLNAFQNKGAYINNYHSSSKEIPSLYSTKTKPSESIVVLQSNPLNQIRNPNPTYTSDGIFLPQPIIHSGRITNSESSSLGGILESLSFPAADDGNDAGESVTSVKYVNTLPSQNSNPLSSTKYFLSASYVDPTSTRISEPPVEMNNLLDPTTRLSVETMGPNALRNVAEGSMSQLLSVQNFNHIFNSKPKAVVGSSNEMSRSPEMLNSEQTQTYYVNKKFPHKTVYPRPMKVVMSTEDFINPTNGGRQPETVATGDDEVPQSAHVKNQNKGSAFSSIVNGGQNRPMNNIENESRIDNRNSPPFIPYTIRHRNPYYTPSVMHHSVSKKVLLTPMAISDLKSQLPDHVVAMTNNISEALGENPTQEAWTSLFQRFEHFFKHAERILSGENNFGNDNPVVNLETKTPNSKPQQIVSPVEIRIPTSIASDSTSTQHPEPVWNEASYVIDEVADVANAQLSHLSQNLENNSDKFANPFDSGTSELINDLINAQSLNPLINDQTSNTDATQLKTKLSDMLDYAGISILRDPPMGTNSSATLGQSLQTQITLRPDDNESFQSLESHYFQPMDSDYAQSPESHNIFQTDETQYLQSVKPQNFSQMHRVTLLPVKPQNYFPSKQNGSLLAPEQSEPPHSIKTQISLPSRVIYSNASDDLTSDGDLSYDTFTNSKEHFAAQSSVPLQKNDISGSLDQTENPGVILMTDEDLNDNQSQNFQEPEIEDDVGFVPSRLVIVYKPVLFVSHENGSHWSRLLGKGYRPTVMTESGETSAALTKEVLDALDPDLLENIRDHFVRDELYENPKVSEITVDTGGSLSQPNPMPDKFIIIDDLDEIRVNETDQKNSSNDPIMMEKNISTTTPRTAQPTKPGRFIDIRNMDINTFPEVVDIRIESVKSIHDLIVNNLITTSNNEQKGDQVPLSLSEDSNKINMKNTTNVSTVSDTSINAEERDSKLHPSRYVHNIIMSRNSDISLEEPKGSQIHALSELKDVNPGMWWISHPSTETDTKKQYVVKRIVKRRKRKPSRLRSRIFTQRVNSGNSSKMIAGLHPTIRHVLPDQMASPQKEQARSFHRRPKVTVIARPVKRDPFSSEARRLGHLMPVPKRDGSLVTPVDNPIENISQLVRRLYNSAR